MNGIRERPFLRLSTLLSGWILLLWLPLVLHGTAKAWPHGEDEDFQAYFKGRLGHYPIELYIEKHSRTVSGRYIQRFKSGQRSIELTGYIDPQEQIHLNGKGTFTGRIEGDTLEGVWHRSADSREKYPFTLIKKDPDYYTDSYWQRKTLGTGSELDLPRGAGIKAVSA